MRMMSRLSSSLIPFLMACGGTDNPPSVPPVPAAPVDTTPVVAPVSTADASAPIDAAAPAQAISQLASKSISLPGVTLPISYDYLAIDRSLGRVYLALSNGGSLDVYDVGTAKITKVDGFKTVERDFNGKKKLFGPSSAAVGDGVVYVGNRATNEVCVVDATTLKVGKCTTIPASIDGLAYVPSAKEVWVTTPKDNTLRVLDASKPSALKPKTIVNVGGAPEGFAVDDAHGLFFTNLEDKGSTLAIGIDDHKIRSTWNAACGSDGPRGVAVDSDRQLVFVACTDHIQTLDAAHDGALLGKLDTGAGVDNIDYLASSAELVVAAGKAAKITVARIDEHGSASVVSTGATAPGSRNAVVDASGAVYVPDPANGALLVLSRK